MCKCVRPHAYLQGTGDCLYGHRLPRPTVPVHKEGWVGRTARLCRGEGRERREWRGREGMKENRGSEGREEKKGAFIELNPNESSKYVLGPVDASVPLLGPLARAGGRRPCPRMLQKRRQY